MESPVPKKNPGGNRGGLVSTPQPRVVGSKKIHYSTQRQGQDHVPLRQASSNNSNSNSTFSITVSSKEDDDFDDYEEREGERGGDDEGEIDDSHNEGKRSVDRDKMITDLKQTVQDLQERLHKKDDHIKTLELSNNSIRNTLLMTKHQYFKLQQDYGTLNTQMDHNRTQSLGSVNLSFCCARKNERKRERQVQHK
ncbi:hypothetical protein RFI_16575 [Reticulomyxa filosa]|uniref:Uncharacterized protein n=1 Tax=Reticulomyxa filosa TaxID=46433 RepID=X6N2Y8_RETFI|nr:hypothetical protein RFI_16575 [Reticulomyxa filosa]|eukprot:ETO20640.1 hypothetical protein RFI_16575 [Reticulomyxa filosa]